jgi:hypothetical protein
MIYKPSSSRNKLQQQIQNTERDVGSPDDDQDKIGYGLVSAVKPESSQVKVRMFQRDGSLGKELSNGAFLPLINSLENIHLMWGQLRKGLFVRIYYRGKMEPKRIMVEVIGDEETDFLRKEPKQNDMETGIYKFFSGGLT